MGSFEEQYAVISKEIENENQSEMDFLISSLAAAIINDSSNKEDDSGKERNHLENITALLCLRIAVAIQLINDGKTELFSQLEEDIDAVLEKICSIEYEWEKNDDVVDHLADIITVLTPNNRDKIYTVLRNRYKHRYRRTKEISSEMYTLFVSIAAAFQRLDKPDLFSLLLEGLCSISRERNGKVLHREVVSKVLSILCDAEPETSVRIARQNLKYFEQVKDDYSGDFYWFYACALQQQEKNAEAIANFEKCYTIRKDVSGEDDWYTVIARREYNVLLYSSYRGESEFNFLLKFVNDIENGKFNVIDKKQLEIIEGKTLYILLLGKADTNELGEFESLIKKFENICVVYDQSPEPLLKRRLAYNIRGNYYMQQGNYILAEDAFHKAIEAEIPEGVSDIITVEQIESNLLLIYYAQNDVDMAMPVIHNLLTTLEDEDNDSALTEKDELRIYTMLMGIASQSLMDLNTEEIEDAKASMNETCNAILSLSDELPESKSELAAFVINLAALMLQAECSSKEELLLYLDALDKINREYLVFPLNTLQYAILNHTAALLAWTVNDDRAHIYFDKSFEIFNNSGDVLPFSTKGAMMLSYATFSALIGKYNAAKACVAQAMNQMGMAWKNCVKYLNDDRLIQILFPTQLQFSGAYALFRTLVNDSSAYERVLQFKALASLAGKERNRILHSSHMDQTLLNKIHAVQDKIAALETESQFRNITYEYETEQKTLRNLETEFAKAFPSQNNFMPITWDNIQKAVPDNSVVIEYYYCGLEYGKRQFDEGSKDPKMGFDVFITQKRKNVCKLARVVVEDCDDLLSITDEFVEILQAESNSSATLDQISKLDDLREILFRSIVCPILPYVNGFDTVYLAPDLNLSNLPFEILYDEDQESLNDEHTVIKIECARDFLYRIQPDNPDGGSLIIGDPQYDIRERDLGSRNDDSGDLTRSIHLKYNEIKRLPFSQIEAKQISRRLNNNCFTGFSATKYLLTKEANYKNVHIATHGYYNLSEESSGMYSSCLLFAGVSNWLKDGKTSSVYGNGILTADEISRLNYRNTELVVLSSCLSGMSDVALNKGFQGMIGAFSAAGAHYIITHLWEADDFSTAVFMDAFYYQYAEKQVSPPAALNLAKNYLRNVTIGDLKKSHWFEKIRSSSVDADFLKYADRYEALDDEIRPFKNEGYWGGFTCYQCY